MKKHILAVLFNILCIGYLFWQMSRAPEHQAVLVFLYYYPVLVFVNFATWGTLKVFGHSHYSAYKYTSWGSLLILVPLYFIATRM